MKASERPDIPTDSTNELIELHCKISNIKIALEDILSYCQKQAAYNSNEKALWMQCGNKARAALKLAEVEE